jgi:hypothetical protein
MPENAGVVVTKTVTIDGTDGKPALELAEENGGIRVTVLPRQGTRRKPVPTASLRRALDALESA